MLSEEKFKLLAIIQFFVGLCKAMDMLNRSLKTPSVAWSLVYKLQKRYSVGRETIMNDDRCGCPVSKSQTSDVKSRCVISRYSLN